ncbi:hypothetical protein HID58_063811 [Brassica napus]|uniref:BnaC05g00800D protein n=3 Tax=Brassica napus TaxID=3708 RepID=A0A078FPZ5_BRANA|nr:hypothetical protein HID58_063811 [Brassica napus]CAF1923421.1 unnamed protein product [Brassica napus]CDY15201.1 BnaC05g00800D [Brassica napus]
MTVFYLFLFHYFILSHKQVTILVLFYIFRNSLEPLSESIFDPSLKKEKSMSTVGELACSYAVMILEDEGISITADKIATLIKSAGVSCESYWPMLFAKMAEKRNVTDLIMNVGAGGGGGAPVSAAAPAAGGGAAAPAPAAEEKKKEEVAEESDGDLGFGLFD